MSVNRNYSVDLFRYIFAILVVAIHTSLFSDVNNELYFYVVGIICRLAVPFFAICTGYFLKKQMKSSVSDSPVSFLPFVKQWKKLLRLYFFWSVIYLFFSIPMWIKIDWLSMWAFIDYGVGALTKGSHYHLWFILSMLYALPVMYVAVTKLNHKLQISVAVVLYSVKTVMYGYLSLLPESINKIFSAMDKLSGFTDAVFCILPFMLIGYCMDNCKETSNRKAFLLFLVYLTLWITEAKLTKTYGAVSYSYLFFPAPCILLFIHSDSEFENIQQKYC